MTCSKSYIIYDSHKYIFTYIMYVYIHIHIHYIWLTHILLCTTSNSLLVWVETQLSFKDIASPEALLSGNIIFLQLHTARNWRSRGRVGDFLLFTDTSKLSFLLSPLKNPCHQTFPLLHCLLFILKCWSKTSILLYMG